MKSNSFNGHSTHKANFMERLAGYATKFTGSSLAFIIAVGVIIIWAITGPMFEFSDTWQLVINTGTTIITFLMVFLIQRAQNKDAMVMQLKLNELIAAQQGVSNRLVDIEDVTEAELKELHQYYVRLANDAKKELDLRSSHSIEEETPDKNRRNDGSDL